MLNNIKRSLFDLSKHKIYVIALIIFLVIFNVYIFTVAQTLVVHFSSIFTPSVDNLHTFDTIKIDSAFQYSEDHVIFMNNILESDSFSRRFSNSLSSKYNRSIWLYFGNPLLISDQMGTNDLVKVFSFDASGIDDIDFLNNTYKINIINSSSLKIDIQNDDVIIFVQDQCIVNQLFHANPEIIFDLISELHVRDNAHDLISTVENYVHSKLPSMIIRGNFWESDSSIVHHFLLYMLIPLLIVFTLIGIISFKINHEAISDILDKELTIHLLHGATEGQIMSRFISFYGFILLVSASLIYQLGLFNHDHSISIIASYSVISLFLFKSIYRSVKRKNHYDSLRKDTI